jgi:uroporphyrinogen decarboxylase
MNHRERVRRALEHQEADRVPLDFGTTTSTTITAGAYKNLTAYLNLPDAAQTMRVTSSIVFPSEAVLKRFDIDTRGLVLGSPINWQDKHYADGTMEDEWGVTWHRPLGGHWYAKKAPFAGEADIRALERHRWPDPHDPGRTAGLHDRVKTMHEDTDYAVVLTLPRGVFEMTKLLRGYENSLVDLVADPDYNTALMQAVQDVYLPLVIDALDATAGFIDVVWYGDDLGVQEGLLVSPATYRKLIKPFHKTILDTIRRHTDAYILFHSCGSVYGAIPDLVELGVQALTPVQVSAAGMDTKRLKEEFGDKLSFWGAIDTHHVLPWGTEVDVRAEVHRRIDDLAPGGGYILDSVHNIQDEVPPENVCAMFDEAREYGAAFYKSK